MKVLKISNFLSMVLVLIAVISALLIGVIALIIPFKSILLVMLLLLGVVLVSIPITIVSLVCACRLKIISKSYVVFSIASSCLIAGAGWMVIPFMLNRDINLFFSEQRG